MSFQKSVSVQPAPAVAGDFASANPRFTFDAGPGGLVAGPNGLTVGLFAWVAAYPADPNGTGQQASNTGSGAPTGFVHRAQQALITAYLSEASMVIPAGFDAVLHTGGDFWAKNDGSTMATVGMKAYANNGTGKISFAATGSTVAGGTSTVSTIAAASPSVSFTGSISGNVLTVSAVSTGTIAVGGTIGGSDGTTSIATGTTVISQISGTVGGVGVYGIDIGEQTVNSCTITQAYGVLTVGGTVGGTWAVGQLLGTVGGVAAGTIITALGTGTGGAGTYIVNKSQSVGAAALQSIGATETKWYAMSQGLAGELVKISDHATG